MDLARGRLYEPEKSTLENMLAQDAALRAELHFYKQVYAAMPKAAARRAEMILQEMRPGLLAAGLLFTDEMLLAAIKGHPDSGIGGQLPDMEKAYPEFARRMAELRRLADNMDAMVELKTREKIRIAAEQWKAVAVATEEKPIPQPVLQVQRNNIYRIALLAASFTAIFFACWLVLQYMNNRYDPLALQNLTNAPETAVIASEPAEPAHTQEAQPKKKKGITAIQSKRFEEAEMTFKQYVSENQNDRQAVFYLGLSYLFNQKPLEAEAAFIKVVQNTTEQDEYFDRARWYLCNLYLAKAANKDKGIQLLQDIAEDNQSRFREMAAKKLQSAKEQ